MATLTLRRADQANRLESDDLRAIADHIARVNAREDVLVLRLVAEGRYFCSGYNVNQIDDLDAGPHFQTAPDALASARPVTIAAMNGPAYGGASDLALACDFRLGVASLHVQVPAVRLGLHFYQSGMERFVSRLGLGTAKRLLLRGERFEADELRTCGFLDQVLPDAESLQAALDEWTRSITSSAPLAVLGMKRHLDAIALGRVDAGALLADMRRADLSADLLEGLAAFREKRPPVFHGR